MGFLKIFESNIIEYYFKCCFSTLNSISAENVELRCV